MAELGAPPSYDDLVPSGPEGSLQPTAPPLDAIVGGDQPDHPQQPYFNNAPTTDERRRSGPAPTSPTRPKSGFIERYITYSIAHRLRKYIEPKSEQQDPELDVEAQFGRTAVRSAQMAIEKKQRLQCISGWLWCIAVILVMVYTALPLAMIVVGALGIGNCPFRSNTIVIYLIGGGVILAVTVVLRGFPSIMTCIRNRNYCSVRESSVCGECICATEVLFYIAMLVNFVALILGLYTTFAESRPPSCLSNGLDPNCCDVFVYVSCATFTVFQCVLYLFSALFVGLVLCCIRSMDKEMRE